MNTAKAFTGGVAGGFVMALIILAARKTGVTDLSLVLLLGSMVTASIGFATWWFGFFIHLLISGLIGWLYAVMFEKFSRGAGVRTGALLSLVHLTLSGIFLGILPALHPLLSSPPPPVPENTLLAPGFFAVNYGLITTAVFLILHVLYGMIVGAVYKPAPQHRWMYRAEDERRAA